MRGDAAHLRFSALSERPHALLLDLGPDPSPGWLTVTSEGRPLFTGMVGSTPSLSILLPFVRGQATKHDLMLYFEPAVGSDGPGLHIFEIGLRGIGLASMRQRHSIWERKRFACRNTLVRGFLDPAGLLRRMGKATTISVLKLRSVSSCHTKLMTSPFD